MYRYIDIIEKKSQSCVISTVGYCPRMGGVHLTQTQPGESDLANYTIDNYSPNEDSQSREGGGVIKVPNCTTLFRVSTSFNELASLLRCSSTGILKETWLDLKASKQCSKKLSNN